MNRNTFISVMSQIDSQYIDEAMAKRARLCAKEAASKPRLLLRALPIAAAIAVIVSVSVTVFSLASRSRTPSGNGNEPSIVPPVSDVGNTTENEGNVTTPEDKYTNTLVEGAKEIIVETSEKPNTDLNGVGLIRGNFLSYYLKSETAYLKVSFGFTRSYINKIIEENADSYDYHPKFRAYNVHAVLNKTHEFSYNELFINGSFQEFTKSFSMDDIESLQLSKDFPEIIELDFSKMKEGDEGMLLLYFGNFFPETEEYGSVEKLRIYYSVGKNGIGLSLGNINLARKNLTAVENSDEAPTTQSANFSY